MSTQFRDSETLADFTHRHLACYRLSVTEFAELLAVSRRTVYDQFNDPKDWFLQCLAAFTGTDADDLRKRYPSMDESRIMRLRAVGQHYREMAR